MKNSPPKTSRPKRRLAPVNWFGLVAGALMLILPFLGPWWQATVGTGAMEVALSPFDYSISLLGQPIWSALVGYFLLAAKLSVIIGGVLMIAGSIGAKRWWGRQLVRFGAMKVCWMLVGLIVLLVLGALFLNSILPGMLSGMAGEAGGATMQINVPYISGSAMSTIQIGTTATITAPITASLTSIFWVAVVVAALCVAARVYHRRYVKPKKLMVKPAEAEEEEEEEEAEDEVIEAPPT
jgi:MFS family permease